jgi:hypothetical protein
VVRALFVVALVVAASGVLAQGRNTGPPTLAGTWQLDPYVSDHPETVARILQLSTGAGSLRPREDARSRGGVGRFGERPRERDGRARTDPAGEPVRESISDADRQVLNELTGGIRFAPTRLTISQNGPSVTIAGDDREPLTLSTEGRTEKQTVGSATVDRRAMWEGPQLVVSYEVGKAGALTLRYERAPTTGQLVIRAFFTRREAETSALEVKLVYDPVVERQGPGRASGGRNGG